MKKALSAFAALAVTACATAPVPPEAPLVPYMCEGEHAAITADYYARDPRNTRVILTINGKPQTLRAIETSSSGGDRYASNPGLKPKTLIWWNKEDRALLFEVAATPNGYTYEKQLAACSSSAQPLAVQSLPSLGTGSTAMEGSIPGTAPGFIAKTIPNPGVK